MESLESLVKSLVELLEHQEKGPREIQVGLGNFPSPKEYLTTWDALASGKTLLLLGQYKSL